VTDRAFDVRKCQNKHFLDNPYLTSQLSSMHSVKLCCPRFSGCCYFSGVFPSLFFEFLGCQIK